MATKKAATTEQVEVVDGAAEENAPVETTEQTAPVETADETVPVETADARVETVPATTEPDSSVEAEPAPRHEVIVVDAPVPPRRKGNRGMGILLAVAGAIVFAALLAVAAYLIPAAQGGTIADPKFYFPPILFLIGSALVSIVLNRAGWWAHIAGSVVVGLIVWFGSASLVLLSEGMLSMNQTQAHDAFYAALFSPLSIVAALLAREIAMWVGAILARRGRALKVRNIEAQQAYEHEQAALTPTA